MISICITMNRERKEDVIEGVKVNEDEDEILEAVSFGDLEYDEDALTVN